MGEIWKDRYDRFDSLEEFMEGANEKGYDYSMEDVERLYDSRAVSKEGSRDMLVEMISGVKRG